MYVLIRYLIMCECTSVFFPCKSIFQVSKTSNYKFTFCYWIKKNWIKKTQPCSINNLCSRNSILGFT